MKIRFFEPDEPRDGLVAEAMLIFEEAALRGITLSGLAVWQRPGAQYPVVSLPSRSYHSNGVRRHYWFLRGDAKLLASLKRDVVAEFLRQRRTNDGGKR